MDQINNTLKLLGLSEKDISVYLLLNKSKNLTATAISRAIKIPKTTVYRTLDHLKNLGIVNENLTDTKRSYETTGTETLKNLVAEKEQSVKKLKRLLPPTLRELTLLSMQNQKSFEIKSYTGIEGLKQVTWNSSKAKGILRIFEINEMSAFLNYDFCEYTRLEFVKNKVQTHELTNEPAIEGWTNVTEMVKNYWQLRYVDPNELSMGVEILVYNNVVALYNYVDGEIFCVEIYNARLAKMQKQIFDFIWTRGGKFKVLNDHGAAKLI
ncbi:transcriptional repressor [Candidatus Dojkabacteria bacterium]|nr:transcriptional repressor [Candidatus Dojkabacteria bacterium]